MIQQLSEDRQDMNERPAVSNREKRNRLHLGRNLVRNFPISGRSNFARESPEYIDCRIHEGA